MTEINLKTNRIRLRPMVNKDLSVFFHWMSDMRNLHLWWADRVILSYEQFVTEFDHRERVFFGHFFAIEEIQENTDDDKSNVIGLTYTYNVNYIDQHAYLCIYLTPEKMGRGIGFDVGYTICNYLFSIFGLRKLYAEVFEFNQRSLALTKRNGFIEEGKLTAHRWFDDKHWDLIILALTREQFKKIDPPKE